MVPVTSNSRTTTRNSPGRGSLAKVIAPDHRTDSGWLGAGVSSTTEATPGDAGVQPRSEPISPTRASTVTVTVDLAGPFGASPPTTSRAWVAVAGSSASDAERSGASCAKSASTTWDSSTPGMELGW